MVVLIVQFKQKGTTVADTRALNEGVVPLIDAQKGFLSKLWLGSDETNDYAGVYRFESKEDAEAYVKSDIIKVLKSLPTLDGELTCKIYELYREQKASSGD